MTKLDQIKMELNKIFEANKVSKKAKEAILKIVETNLAKGQRRELHPPKIIDGINYYYCRFHQRYEPENQMVMSKGKSKGYCKASISKWNKMNRKIKELNNLAINILSDSQDEKAITKAQEIAKEVQELKAKLNDPSSYNYEEDWKVFNKQK